MKKFCALLCLVLFAAAVALAQSSATTPTTTATHLPERSAPASRLAQSTAAPAGPLARRVEAYLRNLYALGPSFTVKVGEPQPTPIPGLRAVAVDISIEGQSNNLTMFVSEDGRYLLQGDLADMQADPFAKLRAEMDLSAAPSRGPADAKVVVVEYGDLQCPSCRRLSEILRGLYPAYPQVRFVFREFPLTRIHAWAETAAIAGRCIYHQDPAAFWPYSDYMFDHQDTINADNVWDTVLQRGVAAGYDAAAFKACMADPAMKAEVDKSAAEGVALKVANTPTVFVNGRRLVGGDRESLTQFIDYELARTRPAAKP
jgi:protein-disulfide isomerase